MGRASRDVLFWLGALLVVLLATTAMVPLAEAKAGGRSRSSYSSSRYSSYSSGSYSAYRTTGRSSYSSRTTVIVASTGGYYYYNSGYRYYYNDYHSGAAYYGGGTYYSSSGSSSSGGFPSYVLFVLAVVIIVAVCYARRHYYNRNGHSRTQVPHVSSPQHVAPAAYTQDTNQADADRGNMFTAYNPPRPQPPDGPGFPLFGPGMSQAQVNSFYINGNVVTLNAGGGDRSLTSDKRVSNYFEVTVQELGDGVSVGIGFSTKPYPDQRMPGWNNHSIAHHNDGRVFFNNDGEGNNYTAPFGRFQTIGCGYTVVGSELQFWFTRNGQHLGVAAQTNLLNQETFACIGGDGYAVLSVNFGQTPFMFNPPFPPMYQQQQAMQPMMAAPYGAAPPPYGAAPMMNPGQLPPMQGAPMLPPMSQPMPGY